MIQNTPPRAIRKPELCARIGLSMSSIARRIQAGTFPRPFALGHGRSVAWLESDVDAWLEQQIARTSEANK